MVNQSWSTGDLEPKTTNLFKPISKSKAKKEYEGHEFFKQAALLANHNWDEELLSSPETHELISSHLLDESFQERLELFVYQPVVQEVANTPTDQALVLDKSISLAPENIISFHQKLRSLSSDNSSWPLMLWLNDQSRWFVADYGRLFCSLRLKKKSLQVKNGADPKTRYFHLAIRDSKKPQKKIDLLYWLQFDDEQNPVKGDFIGSPAVKFLLSPAEFQALFKMEERLVVAPSLSSLNKMLKIIGRS